MRNLKKQHNLSAFFVQNIDIDPPFQNILPDCPLLQRKPCGNACDEKHTRHKIRTEKYYNYANYFIALKINVIWFSPYIPCHCRMVRNKKENDNPSYIVNIVFSHTYPILSSIILSTVILPYMHTQFH